MKHITSLMLYLEDITGINQYLIAFVIVFIATIVTGYALNAINKRLAEKEKETQKMLERKFQEAIKEMEDKDPINDINLHI